MERDSFKNGLCLKLFASDGRWLITFFFFFLVVKYTVSYFFAATSSDRSPAPFSPPPNHPSYCFSVSFKYILPSSYLL